MLSKLLPRGQFVLFYYFKLWNVSIVLKNLWKLLQNPGYVYQ